MLSRHKAKPSREVAPPSELTHVRREGGNRHRADRADPGHGLEPLGYPVFFRGGNDTVVQLFDLGSKEGDLIEIEPPQVPDQVRQVILFQAKGEALDVANALTQDDAVFGKMAAQCVHQLGALADEQIAGAKEHRSGLLRGALHRHRPHVRSLGRLGNRFRFRGIVLLPLHEGFDIDGRDEPDVMAEPGEFPAPVMRGAAILHGHDTWR